MHIYPAIDIRKGKCVRLIQGKADNEVVYREDPLVAAQDWFEKGARRLHIVDLDGAFAESKNNFETIIKIAATVSIPIQMGGGIRTIDKIEYALKSGIARVILGTIALEKPDLVSEALNRFGDKIAVGIDARNGFVSVKGWTQDSVVNAFEFAQKMKDLGVKTIVYTDIAKDGMLSGPNFECSERMVSETKLYVIASGGISTKQDLVRLKDMGLSGAIVGKSLYDGKLNLNEIMELEV